MDAMDAPKEKILRIGLLGAGGTFKMDGTMLHYQHPYGRFFTVPLKDIQTVSVDSAGWGKCFLKIVGGGTELAKEKMPVSWAKQAQAWILENK